MYQTKTITITLVKASIDLSPFPPHFILLTLKHFHGCQVHYNHWRFLRPFFPVLALPVLMQPLIRHKRWNECQCWTINDYEDWTRPTRSCYLVGCYLENKFMNSKKVVTVVTKKIKHYCLKLLNISFVEPGAGVVTGC